MNKQDIPEELKKKLDQFAVETPDISLKKSLSHRIGSWITAPVKNPADYLSIHITPRRMALFPLVIIVSSLPFAFI
ncbi:hypothetical protein F9U64_20370 [Gracilibacillus oryzae]|uniref:Uncharacterized protein n=1 Tax=Gracilibacillus oryzae TaxID=1672701 RepID=A0A7C8KPW0_9BACI|nr:hypothetical protein [Gracilibacillus oryzae]KAB8126203.1 hypothetical protein F9U64_20370 [Gracilibacillus oryzae]